MLEYVDGGELFSYIVENGTLEQMEAVRIFRQILSAVAYCHEFLVCHRDVKPENILLDRNGNVKLADFGMASREHMGGLQTSCGSPHYAPPEIALGRPYIGAQVDVWSCGVVLFVMLAGQLPFGMGCRLPEDLQGVLEEVVACNISFPEDVEISGAAQDLLLRMLEPDQNERINVRQIWQHPLMKYYEAYSKHPDYAARWPGGPPPALTSADCGEPIKKRSDIDMDVLMGVCTLWHSTDQEQMVATLMHPQ